jgi:hypothetical protein
MGGGGDLEMVLKEEVVVGAKGNLQKTRLPSKSPRRKRAKAQERSTAIRAEVVARRREGGPHTSPAPEIS